MNGVKRAIFEIILVDDQAASALFLRAFHHEPLGTIKD
jgi:hypothetical protein